VIGFIVSVVWIFVVADTTVDLLSTLGMLCGVSDAIVGLVVLGLGNSVGDLVANIAVARSGCVTHMHLLLKQFCRINYPELTPT
jgi:sodium/potassium/calcium exchanger 6